ncbi:MAG: MFS transporter [Saccharolobus sp.]|jgi:MFS family permease|uniref:MFS transporter n=1 Tax=Saccharolobus sp. TaxID=2100761 RepID=UPI0028CFA71A|nr:MFS transporter [Saccharolobus sp.]MDT7862418.1 MFS transporter [Saccharolobus sp.]
MAKNLMIGWFGTFLQLLLRLSWGVIDLPIALLLHLNSVEMGFVATAFYIGYVTSSIPWGLIIDKIGPAKSMLISSFILVFLNLILFLSINSYLLLVIIYLIDGLIAAAIFPSAMKILAVSYGDKLTFYVALLESAGPITILFLSLIATILLNTWRLFYLFISIGFLTLVILTTKLNVKNVSSEVRKSFRIIFDKKITLATLIRLGELWSTWGTTTWIFSMLVLYRHISPEFSAVFLFLFGLGQLIGILTVERLSSILGDKRVILINLLGFIILTILVIFSTGFMIFPEAFLMGIFSFSYRPPTDSLIMKIAGESKAGTSIGYANAVSQIGTLIAPTFVGFVLYITHSFAFSMISLDIGCIISIICLFLL